jgi:hypothetical protein
MASDLTERLHAYLNATSEQKPAATHLYADALSSSNAAAAAASASIICSHARLLRGNSELIGHPPGLDEIEILIGGKQPEHPAEEATGQKPPDETEAPKKILPLRPTSATIEDLARGAEGVPAIRKANG